MSLIAFHALKAALGARRSQQSRWGKLEYQVWREAGEVQGEVWEEKGDEAKGLLQGLSAGRPRWEQQWWGWLWSRSRQEQSDRPVISKHFNSPTLRKGWHSTQPLTLVFFSGNKLKCLEIIFLPACFWSLGWAAVSVTILTESFLPISALKHTSSRMLKNLLY